MEANVRKELALSFLCVKSGSAMMIVYVACESYAPKH